MQAALRVSLALAALGAVVGASTAAATSAVAAAPTRETANSMTYQDSTGEDPAAPDITSIVVSNNDARAISFRVDTPNRATLTEDMLLWLFVDADTSAATGDPASLGADYLIQILRGEAQLFRWDGDDFTRQPGNPPATTLGFSYSGGATVRINADELGETRRFGFAVIALSGAQVDSEGNVDLTDARSDFAPESESELFSYQVLVAPPQTSPPRPQPPRPPQQGGKTYADASRLPARARYVGISIKHVRLGERLYDTMQVLRKRGTIRVPRVIAIACWSKADWPSVAASTGFDRNPNRLVGFFAGPRQPRWVHIAPKQCADVQALMVTRRSNGQRAFALAAVLHERVHAEGVGNEVRTNCYAVQLVYDFARQLDFAPAKALRLEQLAVRKTRQVAPRGYWSSARCRDGGAWDLYPELRSLDY